jgi:hypothetical protein
MGLTPALSGQFVPVRGGQGYRLMQLIKRIIDLKWEKPPIPAI